MKEGWTIKRLTTIADKITDGSHNPPQGVQHSDFLMLSSKNVFDDDLHYEAPRYLTAEQFRQEDKRTGITPGDVLLTIVGTIGRSAVVSNDTKKITLQRSVAVIRPRQEIILPRFLMYSFISRNVELNDQARGVAQKGIYLETLRKLGVALPPLPEQQRIVGILDEAFGGIAKAKANTEQALQKARAIFESLLNDVFEDSWKSCELVTLLDLATDITDGDHLPPPKSETGIPFITIGNINKETRRIDFSNTFMVPHEYVKRLKPNKKPKRGDVLYTVTGSLGIPVLVNEDIEFCFQRHIGLIRPKSSTNSAWLNYLLLSPQVFKQADDGATGAAQKTVSLKVLRNFIVPRVPLAQQQYAVKKLDALSAETRRLESLYQQKLTALDNLKKSLLHQAFNGEL